MVSDISNVRPSSGRATVRRLIASLACVFALLGGGGWIAPAAAQAPTVTSISPNSGPAAGGTVVIIMGTNFTASATVKFGNTAVTAGSVVFVGTSEIAVTSSPPGTGTVDITVTTAGGTSATSAVDQFTYLALPTVTGISPSTGSGAGGTSVTITGTNFTGATKVNFGGVAAASFTVNSATSITATSPAGSGTVDVIVTTPGGTSATSAADQFTFTAVPPTVTSISPNAGPVAGGTQVTINGTNFFAGATVKFGNTAVAAGSVNVVSSTQITVTARAVSTFCESGGFPFGRE